MRDVTVPETKPATEFYFGRPIRKVSPRGQHGTVQGRIAAALLRWADEFGSGRVDVAYLPHERMRSDAEDAEDIAYVAPLVAVEVLSPGNTRAEIEEKRRVFLACGTDLFLVADVLPRTLTVHDRTGTTVLDERQTFTHAALPEFSLPVHEIFRAPTRR